MCAEAGPALLILAEGHLNGVFLSPHLVKLLSQFIETLTDHAL
jgi:hypothetical protein